MKEWGISSLPSFRQPIVSILILEFSVQFILNTQSTHKYHSIPFDHFVHFLYFMGENLARWRTGFIFHGKLRYQTDNKEEPEPPIGEYVRGVNGSEEAESVLMESPLEKSPPHIGESDMVHSHESGFPTETEDMEKSYAPSIGEGSIESLEPLVQESLEKTLEAVLPAMVQRVESALVQSIYRRTEELIIQQLPEAVDKIVTRELEKYR
jgi:hypothetical protein